MAVRKRRSTKVKRKRRPSTVRPISKTSPKGKIALLMLDGSHTYAAMAKMTRTTIHNIYKHAAELRSRGHKISVKDGIVRLVASATIYLSGSCENRAGGYCAPIVASNETYEPIVGSETNTTSNRVILRAAIAALERFKAQTRTALRLYSNSEYLIKNMNERIDEWKAGGWKTKAGSPPDNIDLWKGHARLATGGPVQRTAVLVGKAQGDTMTKLTHGTDEATPEHNRIVIETEGEARRNACVEATEYFFMVPDAIRTSDLHPIALLRELSSIAERGFDTGAGPRRRNASGLAWRSMPSRIARHRHSRHFNRVGRAVHATTYVT
jgi:ribonuclease HI